MCQSPSTFKLQSYSRKLLRIKVWLPNKGWEILEMNVTFLGPTSFLILTFHHSKADWNKKFRWMPAFIIFNWVFNFFFLVNIKCQFGILTIKHQDVKSPPNWIADLLISIRFLPIHLCVCLLVFISRQTRTFSEGRFHLSFCKSWTSCPSLSGGCIMPSCIGNTTCVLLLMVTELSWI